MSNFLDRLRRLIKRQPDSSWNNSQVSEVADEAAVTTLMSLIEKTNEGEYSCEETFDLLDEYVELVAADQDVDILMPLVKKHVEHCPDCGPRYEILLDILQHA